MRGIAAPYLTASLEGIGGRIRARLEDFVVEEIPAYRPCGAGEHTFFAIEKADLSTLEAVGRIAAALGVGPAAMGHAGMKDRKAIAIQHLTVRGVPPEAVRALAIPGVRVLWAERHRNKLRIGHLHGNRFRVAIRGFDRAHLGDAARTFQILRERGVPNYYGPQRFGSRGDSQWVGRAILDRDAEGAIRRLLGAPSRWEADPAAVAARRAFERGEYGRARRLLPRSYRTEHLLLRYLERPGATMRGALRRLPRTPRRLFVSAFQSHLFNLCLARRLARAGGDLERLWAGDVAVIHATGGAFLVEDPGAEQPRADRFEISPSGPIFGMRMPRAAGEEGEIEAGVLAEQGLRVEDFHVLMQGLRMRGGRRPYRVLPRGLRWEDAGDPLWVSFELPKGTYATSLLREVMKNDEPPPAGPEGNEPPDPAGRGGGDARAP